MAAEFDLAKFLQGTRSIFVFDRQTGNVLHVHDVAALPGAELPSDDVLSEQALSLANTFEDVELDAVDTLVVTEALKRGVGYRVDPKTRTIVEVGEREAD